MEKFYDSCALQTLVDYRLYLVGLHIGMPRVGLQAIRIGWSIDCRLYYYECSHSPWTFPSDNPPECFFYPRTFPFFLFLHIMPPECCEQAYQYTSTDLFQTFAFLLNCHICCCYVCAFQHCCLALILLLKLKYFKRSIYLSECTQHTPLQLTCSDDHTN